MTVGPRVAVVGAGIVGAAVAWYLAGRGARVTVLERATAPATGSTGRSAAGLRHQFSLPANVAFSRFSARRFERFTHEVGGDAGFRRVGYLFLVPRGSEGSWRAQERTVREAGGRVELLRPDEVARRWPYLSSEGVALGSFGPDDGTLDPHGATLGYLQGARAAGAELRLGAEVLGMTGAGDGARVTLSEGTLEVDAVVNAAGPQAGEVARRAGTELPVVPSRRNVYVTRPLAGLALPTPLVIDAATGVWLRSEGERVMFGRSRPDEAPGERADVDWEWLEATLEVAIPRFPFLEGAALDRRASWAGSYEMTPDRLPAIGRDARLPWLVHAAGFSGHGVQHAPATGIAVADVVTAGACGRFDLGPFDPGRFASGAVEGAREGGEARIV